MVYNRAIEIKKEGTTMKNKKLLLAVLSIILVLGMLLTVAACGETEKNSDADVKAMLDDISAKIANLDALAKSNATSAQITESYEAIIAKLQVLDSLSTGEAVKSNSEAIAEQITALQTQIKALDLGLDDNSNDALTIYLNGISAKLNEINKTLLSTIGEPTIVEYSDECYEKLQYIDSALRDRDCIYGQDFKLSQNWIVWTAKLAGYTDSDISFQDVTYPAYAPIATAEEYGKKITANKKVLDKDKFYKKVGRKYPECEESEATHKKYDVTSPNIIITKKGKSEKQIIVGAHYDGTGTGDNGSGVSLALTTAEKIKNIETEYTIVFVFFTAEEIGTFGAEAYAKAMTTEEIAKTLYYINLDSVVCGDFTYLYGGVQQDDLTVTDTEAYDNAVEVAKTLGLEFKTNPWTVAKPAPGKEVPDYVSPSTGDWSDHAHFKEIGIKYLYMEATNWEIPGPFDDYDGYGETYLVGMIMNTSKDYLAYIEKYFPGRIQEHFEKFSALLYALVTQDNVNF